MSIGYNAYPEDMTFLTTGTEEKEESPYSQYDSLQCTLICVFPISVTC